MAAESGKDNAGIVTCRHGKTFDASQQTKSGWAAPQPFSGSTILTSSTS
jgi:hypothetical protein